MMTIDFSKALDTVNRTKLLQAVSSSSLNHNIVRRLVAYLRGKSASCRCLDVTSVCHAVRTTGVLQGSAISPLHLNQFVSTHHNNVQLYTDYADDVHTAELSVKPQLAR